LGEFIEGTSAPLLKANRPRISQDTLDMLMSCFSDWYPWTLASITIEDVERWRAKRLTEGNKPATVARYLAALAGVLTRAM
jgi:hypothetical protein